VHIATDDILSHDALIFVDQARASGSSVDLHIGHGLMHAWPLLPMPEARTSREAMSAFLSRP
jgi:acetyl esterase/lipase